MEMSDKKKKKKKKKKTTCLFLSFTFLFISHPCLPMSRPKPEVSVDYPSTRGKLVNVG